MSGLADELHDKIVIDVGGLSAARYLEGMAYLNIAMNAQKDLPWQSGWKLVGPVA